MQTTKDYRDALKSIQKDGFGAEISAKPPVFCRHCNEEMFYAPYTYETVTDYGLGYFFCFGNLGGCSREILSQALEETFLGFDEK